MQIELLHLRVSRKVVPGSKNQAPLPETNGRKSISSGWTVDISGITLFHIVALNLLVLTTASAMGAVLALVLAGFQLCPPSMAIAVFRECGIGGLSSGLSAILLGHRLRK